MKLLVLSENQSKRRFGELLLPIFMEYGLHVRQLRGNPLLWLFDAMIRILNLDLSTNIFRYFPGPAVLLTSS